MPPLDTQVQAPAAAAAATIGVPMAPPTHVATLAPARPDPLTVTITASTYGLVTAATLPGARCEAAALLPSAEQSAATGLAAAHSADAHGFVSWKYDTSSSTTPGIGYNVVACSDGGPTVWARAPFTVVGLAPPPMLAASGYVGEGGAVTRISDDGEYVLLDDRSLWQIEGNSGLDTDSITIIEDSSCLDGYLLVDMEYGETACGRYLGVLSGGQGSPTSMTRQQIVDYLRALLGQAPPYSVARVTPQTPAPTPTPSPMMANPWPGYLFAPNASGPVPTGYTRYGARVVDASTGSAVVAACVYTAQSMGCPLKGASETNASGYFAVDLLSGGFYTFTIQSDPQNAVYNALVQIGITGTSGTVMMTHK